jgi:predicted component of type VI protein secretion system
MKKSVLLIAFAITATTASPVEARKPPPLTPMELQALQSREYKTSKDQVFSSVVSVFQDMGYQIGGADVTSGFINATSANKNKTGFFEAMAGVTASGASRVTAFVETMPSGLTRVRLNFMNTKNSSSRFGSSSNDKPILDPKTYQVAFEHIEEALFERGALTKTAPATNAPAVTPAAVAPVAVPTATPAPQPASHPERGL